MSVWEDSATLEAGRPVKETTAVIKVEEEGDSSQEDSTERNMHRRRPVTNMLL